METEYLPPRRTGILIQSGLILLLLVAGGYFFLQANRDTSGLDFLLHMMIALVMFAPLLVIVYRLYALFSATYILRRDGLLIRWGLRREDIPLNDIEWIRPAAELGFHLPMPWLRWPGAILGLRRLPELGQVEFMAADVPHMLLVATPNKVFAISPEDVNGFMTQFRRINELGSLTPIPAQSVYPRLLFGRVWDDKLARLFILGSFGVGLVLLAVVGIAVPGLGEIPWTEAGSTGAGGTAAPAVCSGWVDLVVQPHPGDVPLPPRGRPGDRRISPLGQQRVDGAAVVDRECDFNILEIGYQVIRYQVSGIRYWVSGNVQLVNCEW